MIFIRFIRLAGLIFNNLGNHENLTKTLVQDNNNGYEKTIYTNSITVFVQFG